MGVRIVNGTNATEGEFRFAVSKPLNKHMFLRRAKGKLKQGILSIIYYW